jgi:two-component system cell cycle sensor histidine kinase/response regulator CckA
MTFIPDAGMKTVLVVEDNPGVRKLVQLALEGGGFNVLAAASAKEAMLTEVGFSGRIHLLLSEVLMPDMMGPDLAAAMKERRPEMRVMLMSHYPDGRILLLNYGWYFIEKLALSSALPARVKALLSSSTFDQGTDRFDTRS